MKHLFKRATALLLVACALLATLVPAVSALEVNKTTSISFSDPSYTSETNLSSGYEGTGWTAVAWDSSFGLKLSSTNLRGPKLSQYSSTDTTGQKQWFVLRIDDIIEGATVAATINSRTNSSSGTAADVHYLTEAPADGWSKTTVAELNLTTASDSYLGTLDNYASSGKTTLSFAKTVSGNSFYLLFLGATGTSTSTTYFRLDSMDLTQTGNVTADATYTFNHDNFTNGNWTQAANLNVMNEALHADILDSFAAGEVNWTFESAYLVDADSDETVDGDIIFKNGLAEMRLKADTDSTVTDDPWAAFRLAGLDKAGLYDVAMTYKDHSNNTIGASIYVLPAGEVDRAIDAVNKADYDLEDADSLDAYMAARNTASVAAIADLIDDDTYLNTTGLNLKALDDDTQTIYLNQEVLEADKEYIVVFKADKARSTSSTNAYIPVYSLEMLLIEEYAASVTSTEGTAYYADVEAAIAEANGNPVALMADCGAVAVDSGLTLDLNGHTMTAENFALANGQVKDTYYNAGGIKVTGTADFTDNAWLPLQDGDTYRFFEYNAYSAYDADTGYFWFDVNFAKADAYALLTANGTLGFNLKWNGDNAGEKDYTVAETADSEFMKWVNADHAAESLQAMYVKVSGVTEDITEVIVTPEYVSDSGAKVEFGAIVGNPNA